MIQLLKTLQEYDKELKLAEKKGKNSVNNIDNDRSREQNFSYHPTIIWPSKQNAFMIVLSISLFFPGNSYTFMTNASYSYNYMWLEPVTNYLTFHVRTCNDAHIVLSENKRDTSRSYEVRGERVDR